MCGIVGYVGFRNVSDFLLEGLQRLEYRGYDSAGIVVTNAAGKFDLRKKAGRVHELSSTIMDSPPKGHLGIGHTRWATHGEVNDINSHPHLGGNGEVVLVHNGVIENYVALRSRLQQFGFVFHTHTDTEVIAHLIAHYLEGVSKGQNAPTRENCIAAVESALKELKGTYGTAVMFRDCPEILVAARLGSPLVIGLGKGEHFLASDTSPLVGYSEEVVYLADHEMVVLSSDKMELLHRDNGRFSPSISTLEQVKADIDLGGYEHYMLKEIFEQPHSIENAMRGRLDEDEMTSKFGGLNLDTQQLRHIDRIVLTACGTSWHAGLVGEYLLEEFARIPTEVEYASELRYRNPPLTETTMVFAITQSGETADTLAAMRECKRKGHRTLAFCNVVGSTIAREADGGIYLHAGPEIGVASTKAFTSQVTALTLLAIHLGRMRHLSFRDGQKMLDGLKAMPETVERALQCHNVVREVAEKYAAFNNFLYLGRLYNFPVALEGALKLKEISYIHAEGYPAAEMKHGPIALVDEEVPTVFVIPRGSIYPKVMSNMEEIKARKGPVIAIACEGDEKVANLADDVIFVPDVEDHLQPLVTAIPLQLLAYHIALLRGCDVDRPRNLAKSVTVE